MTSPPTRRLRRLRPRRVGDYDFTLTKTGYVDEIGRSPGEKDDVSVVQGAKTVAAVKSTSPRR